MESAMKRHLPCLASALSCLALATTPATAAGFPEKPVRLIVGFPPGGAGDLLARLAGQALSTELGQSVVVDNRSGAGGIIAAEMVAGATPDGYTVLVGTTGAVTISPSLQPKITYSPTKDFSPVGMIGNFQNVIVVPVASSHRTLKELIAAAKAKPEALNYASTGVGATPHMAGEMLRVLADVQIVHVSYKGNGPAMTDLIAGRVDFMLPTLPSALPHLKAGRLRALAVTGEKRSSALPDVAPVRELGWPTYRVVNWFGLLAPARTSPETIQTLHTALAKGLAKPATQEQLTNAGVESESLTPRQMAAFIEEELARWARVVKAANITLR